MEKFKEKIEEIRVSMINKLLDRMYTDLFFLQKNRKQDDDFLQKLTQIFKKCSDDIDIINNSIQNFKNDLKIKEAKEDEKWWDWF